MKTIVTSFVILNNLVWFLSSIGCLNHLLRGITPPPTKPSLGLFIALFILFLMNLVTLFYILRKTNDVVNEQKGVNMKKIFIGFGWFVIIYIAGSFFIGMIVGAIAGGSATTPAAGAEAGKTASVNFFHAYGLFIFLGAVLAAIIGTLKEWLPFTSDEN